VAEVEVMLLVGALDTGPRRGEEAGEESAGEREPAGVVLVAVLLLLVSLSWLWLWLSISSSSSPPTDEAALEGPVATVVEPPLLLLLLLLLPLVVVATLCPPSGEDETVDSLCFRSSCCRAICGVVVVVEPVRFSPHTTISTSLETKSRPVKQEP
jgi:protein-S-isoprenylcysteine O-methyltransferase Ste14